MAIFRMINTTENTAQLLYKGQPITPVFKLDDPKQLFDCLSQAVEEAYQKLRDAGVDV